MDLAQIKQFLEENKENEDVKAYLEGLTQVTPEGVEAFLETDEGKKVLQPKLDRNFTKGLETWKEKNLKKIVDDEVKKANPQETEEQKRIRELEEMFAEKERESVREKNKNKALTILNDKKLPSSLIDLLITDDEETTLTNIKQYEEVFTSQLESVVEDKLKAGGTSLQDSTKPKVLTLDDIRKMSEEEVIANKEAVEEALRNS